MPCLANKIEFYLLAIYDDNMVSGVIKWMVDWLVFSLKKLCDHLFKMDERAKKKKRFTKARPRREGKVSTGKLLTPRFAPAALSSGGS